MSDYREVLQNPRTAFKSHDLQNANVQLTPLGLPSLVSGGFALTSCLTTQINGSKSIWAIRCFHKEVTDLQERYRYISNFLQDKKDNFFVDFKYETEGIKFQDNWYPIVRMAWVCGSPLNEYIQDNLGKSLQLKALAEQVKLVSQRLHALKMAHGDIQHGNVLIRPDGSLVLIDYDGMYVPGMHYKNSNELGHIAFQHPGRNSSFFNEKLDRFSLIVFYISILTLATNSGQNFWKKYHTGENLIFGRKDYQAPENSQIFSELKNYPELAQLITRFQHICRCSIEDIPSLSDFINPSIKLSSLSVNPILPVISNTTNGSMLAFSVKDTLNLAKQEGEKIIVVGKVLNTNHYSPGKILFINFANPWDNIQNYSPFTIVIFSKGLNNLSKARNINDLTIYIDKYIKITGILELYHNKKGFITPQIILEDPYQLQMITQQEATEILTVITRNTVPSPGAFASPMAGTKIISSSVNPVPHYQPTKPIPPKPVPPKPKPPSPANTPTPAPTPSVSPKYTSVSNNSQTNNSQKIPSNPSNTVPQTKSSQNDSCFIATAAYDFKKHPDLETFRAFRDRFLLKDTVGRYLVKIYYLVGPYLAKIVLSYPPLKKLVRISLEWIAQWMRMNIII